MENGRKKQVLVVDDSASIRLEVKAILEKEGYSVREAGSEFGMFNSIDRYGQLVDIILMDLTLNEEYGFDLIGKLRNVERLKNIPVVMLTNHSDRESVSMAKMLGVQGYIIKPINSIFLVERVKAILEECSLER
jgi:two-component system, chemotaxis family, chemotaxis protein CheY